MSKPEPANVKTRQISCPREIGVKLCSTQSVRILESCGEERGRTTPCFTSTITTTDSADLEVKCLCSVVVGGRTETGGTVMRRRSDCAVRALRILNAHHPISWLV